MFENSPQTEYLNLDGPQLTQASSCLSSANAHAENIHQLLISRDSDANTQILLNIYMLSSWECFWKMYVCA